VSFEEWIEEIKMRAIISAFLLSSIVLNASAFTLHEESKVIITTPVYKTITIKTPYEECWEEKIQVIQEKSTNTLGQLIGGITGGILGNQIGGGNGKTVATIGGAVAGTVVGNNLSKNTQSNTSYETVKKCITKYNTEVEERLIGYNNIANYKGQRIEKFSETKLTMIQIQVHINY